MSLQHKVPVFALLFSLLFFFPHAVHGRHGIRNQHVHRQAGLESGLANALGLGSGGTSPPASSQLPTSNTAPDSSPATSAPTTTTPSLSDVFSVLSQSTPSSQTSNPPTSLPSTSSPSSLPLTSSPASSSPPISAPTSSPAITSPQSSQTPSSQSTSPTSTCSLGVDLFGQCILPLASTTPSGSTPASSASTDVPSTSLPSSQPQTPTSLASSSDTPTSSLLSSIPISLPPLLSSIPASSLSPSSNNPASSPPPSSNPPASSPPLLSNTPISLPLTSSNPISLPPLSPNIPISSPPPSASSPPAGLTDSPPQSIPPQTTSQPAPSLSDNQSSPPSPAPSSSTPIDPCGPLGQALGLCVTTSGTPISAPMSSLGPTPQQSSTLNPSSSSLNSFSQPPPFSMPSSSNPSVSSSSGLPVPLPSIPSSSQTGASSIPGSLSQPASGTATQSSMTFSGTVSGSLTISAPPVISFPSDTSSSGDQTSSVQSTGSFSPVVTPSLNSQFSYVTITSLLGTTLPSSSIPPTLTNPDAATTTLSLPDPSNSAAATAPGAPLPSYLPARIYAPDQDEVDSLPSDYILCSCLFTSFLSWVFVAQNTQSQGQIFSWTPIIIAQALNISTTQTPPYALQVFTPAAYDGPSDVDMLLTEYLFFLPSNLVPDLANQIKVTTSPFYAIGSPYNQLADQIDPAFALTSVSNPNAVPGSASGASSHGNKSRTDTIIGVVSALGGLALVILGILIFNGVKRSRQLRHLRLSDPNLPNDPYPDRSGRDFDQDSVGGPRRRSFYFAEDSLRGGQPHTAEQSTIPVAQAQTQYVVQPESQIQYIPRTSPENIRERRAPVVPGAISAPILTQSSLNW